MPDDTVKLIVDNVYTKIINATNDFEVKLWEKLSFEEQQYNSEYVRVRRLFNRKTKKTYTGLISYVEELLQDMDYEYEIEDNRVRHQPNADFQIQPEFNARPYQEKIINEIEDRAVMMACTGAGKTFMMAGLIAKTNVKPVLVFADKIGLCQQLKDEFEKFLGVPVGIIGDGIRDVQDITVCSIKSMVKNEDELLNSAKMIMVDECLPYDSLILMTDGTYKQIGELVNNEVNDRVMSYNHKNDKLEPKAIVGYSKIPLNNNNKKMMRIKVRKANGTLAVVECTDNHKIWVEDLGEYVMARDLIKGQALKTLS